MFLGRGVAKNKKLLEEKRTAWVEVYESGRQASSPFFLLKGKLEAALSALAADPAERADFVPLSKDELDAYPFLDPVKSASISLAGEKLGVLGEVRAAVSRELKLAKRPGSRF